ncbi:MAG: PEP-CTERM sorting domain-containing protein, partial [Alphaproteobacteria bacterium]
TDAPLPTGALRLTTGADNADKAEVGISDSFGTFGDFLDIGGLAYSFFKSSAGDLNAFAAAAIKIAIFDFNTNQSDAFTTFVFEPTWNQPGNENISQPVPTDQWLDEEITPFDGLFWHTGLYGQPSQAGGGAGAQKTLADWATFFGDDILDATIALISVGVGSFNQGQTAYVDNVRIAAGEVEEFYDFEAPIQVPEPASLTFMVAGLLGVVALGRIRRRTVA